MLLFVDVMACESSHWLYKFAEFFVCIDVLYLDARNLHIEHLTRVEKGLLLLSLQPVEEIIIIWVSKHLYSAA